MGRIAVVLAVVVCVAHTAAAEPIELGFGPHLFLDDDLIAESHGVRRVVNSPVRDESIPNPVITGGEDGCFQPYLSVVRDDTTGRFRAWYGARTAEKDPTRSRLAYMESEDGISWRRPHRLLDTPAIQFGASVIDEGSGFADASRRFKFAWWAPSVAKDAPGGLKIATSPDGLSWKQLIRPGGPNEVGAGDVLLPHDHDINSIFRDPVRKQYMAIASTMQTDAAWSGERRVTMQSISRDLLHWSPLSRILVPDPKTEHEQTQFYAMDGFIVRGDLIIGMVKVLRDDLHADTPPDPPDAYGVGYTALAWTRDGEHWTRDRAVFLDRDSKRDAWDHSHAWIDEQLPVRDDVLLYYGGYARGHKVNRFEERQIGLVRMKRDRYVAREADAEGGRIVTPVVVPAGETITLNADVRAGGKIIVRLLDADGKIVTDSGPITGDGLDLKVTWRQRRPIRIAGRAVRFEFVMRNARLFAVGVAS